MNRTSCPAPRGFTLIELLLVISIIALLAGMVFPITTQMIARAQTTKCMNNLRQLGMAAHAAANDNDNRFPIIESDPANAIHKPEDEAQPLTEVFKRYGITSTQLQCPADLKGPNQFAQKGASYIWEPYSEDEEVQNITIYMRRGQFPGRQSRVRLATDWEPVHPADVVGGRKKFNTLYADGHVRLR